MDGNDCVAMIWVLQSGDATQLVVDARADAVPFDRPRLIKALRLLADSMARDSDQAAMEDRG